MIQDEIVRETWCLCGCEGVSIKELLEIDSIKHWKKSLVYRADNIGGDGWRPSIHMPRWASRITLEVLSVRVERVQEINPRDAMDEGIGRHWDGHKYWWENYQGECNFLGNNEGPLKSFESLWDSINAKRGYGWDKNPWVWVVEFKQSEGREL